MKTEEVAASCDAAAAEAPGNQRAKKLIRPANSFNADEIAAFQAMAGKALCNREFLAIMRHRGMAGLLRKFSSMSERVKREGEAAA